MFSRSYQRLQDSAAKQRLAILLCFEEWSCSWEVFTGQVRPCFPTLKDQLPNNTCRLNWLILQTWWALLHKCKVSFQVNLIQHDLINFGNSHKKNMKIHSKTNIQCLYGFAVRRTPFQPKGQWLQRNMLTIWPWSTLLLRKTNKSWR